VEEMGKASEFHLERCGDGIMEYWVFKEILLFPSFHYSIIPIFQGSVRRPVSFRLEYELPSLSGFEGRKV
jgi:hypothetical protein